MTRRCRLANGRAGLTLLFRPPYPLLVWVAYAIPYFSLDLLTSNLCEPSPPVETMLDRIVQGQFAVSRSYNVEDSKGTYHFSS